jgi:hypothetical protein
MPPTRFALSLTTGRPTPRLIHPRIENVETGRPNAEAAASLMLRKLPMRNSQSVWERAQKTTQFCARALRYKETLRTIAPVWKNHVSPTAVDPGSLPHAVAAERQRRYLLEGLPHAGRDFVLRDTPLETTDDVLGGPIDVDPATASLDPNVPGLLDMTGPELIRPQVAEVQAESLENGGDGGSAIVTSPKYSRRWAVRKTWHEAPPKAGTVCGGPFAPVWYTTPPNTGEMQLLLRTRLRMSGRRRTRTCDLRRVKTAL